MLFNSIEFLFVFFPLCLAAYYAVRRHVSHQAGLAVLSLSSLVFYAWWDAANLPLLLISAVVNYAFGLWIASGARVALAIGVFINLAALGVFKYANFVLDTASSLSGASHDPVNIALPLGISFFTFQQISFLVDVASGRTRPGKLLNHILFVAFFPHLIAGPLVQHHQIARQFADATRKDDLWDNFGVGLSIFSVGLAKKVLLADNLAGVASASFGAADRGGAVGFSDAWVGAIAYSLQIFFDFSGYSDMAIGLARCFGYHLPINFNAPYRADSIIDFWRRWHISLSQFLRDHLYIPLGGNRLGELRRHVNLFVTMLLGGLWHGAAWTFVIWGAIHGVLLALNHVWEKHGPVGRTVLKHKPVRIGLVCLAVMLAWVFFRAGSFDGALAMFAGLAGMSGPGGLVEPQALALIGLCLLLVWKAPDTAEFFYHHLDTACLETARVTQPKPGVFVWRPAPLLAGGAAALLFIAVLNASRATEFIYFAF
jgi:alginate O-acetyltransferase complex protein AlgI